VDRATAPRRRPRPNASGATATPTEPPAPNEQALGGGAYARRYRDREQPNESGHGRTAAECIGCSARRDRLAALDAGVREHQPQPAHDRGGGHQGPPGARQPPRRGAAQLSYPGHTWGTHGRLLEMTRCVRQWGFPLVPFRTARGRGARWPRVGRAVDAPPRDLGSPCGRPPRPVTGSPPSAVVMGRADGAAGLPVVAVALDDGGDVLGTDAMKVQVKAAGTFTRGSSG
jgi:hypothetical protein